MLPYVSQSQDFFDICLAQCVSADEETDSDKAGVLQDSTLSPYYTHSLDI